MKKAYEEEKIRAIADTIREKTGGSTTYTTEDMPSGVAEVYNVGVEAGKLYGDYGQGYRDGKKAEYDAFWDAYGEFPYTVNHDFYFAGNGWTEKNLKPNTDIRPSRANSMFQLNCFSGDLARHFEDLGVILDFSNCTMAASIFVNAYLITRVGALDFSKVLSGAAWFTNATGLITIDKLVVSENTVAPSNSFHSCTALENITVEGVINKNLWNFQWSPKLSKASIESVISCLSATTSGLTVTFSKTAVNKAFETSSGAGDGSDSAAWSALVATKSNWTISLV